jgi:hypothetical protein
MPSLLDHCIRYYFLFFSKLNYLARKGVDLIVGFEYLEHIAKVFALHDLVLKNLNQTQTH